MDTFEVRYNQLAQQILAMGMQATKAYNDAQAELQLELVLSPDRLCCEEGIRASRDTLDRFEALTSAHKETFSKFLIAATGRLGEVIAEMPEEKARAHRASLAASVNRSLQGQARSYVLREEWLSTARRVCELLEDCRDVIEFLDGQFLFFEDEPMEEFNALLARIDELHRLEVENVEERLSAWRNGPATC
jgi:hypothetical protein